MTTTSRRWTDQDVSTLREHWPNAYVARHYINKGKPATAWRTIGAIKAKARQLGLKR